MKRLLIIAAILVIGGCIYGYFEMNRKVEALTDVAPDETVTANSLLTAFQTGEEAANVKYLGKVVEVAGAVREASQNEGKTIVRLDAGDSMDGVTCELDGNVKHKRTDFKTGDAVTFKCTCTGFLMDVVLVGCVEK
jgi:tRNA_anti-like